MGINNREIRYEYQPWYLLFVWTWTKDLISIVLNLFICKLFWGFMLKFHISHIYLKFLSLLPYFMAHIIPTLLVHVYFHHKHHCQYDQLFLFHQNMKPMHKSKCLLSSTLCIGYCSLVEKLEWPIQSQTAFWPDSQCCMQIKTNIMAAHIQKSTEKWKKNLNIYWTLMKKN